MGRQRRKAGIAVGYEARVTQTEGEKKAKLEGSVLAEVQPKEGLARRGFRES